MDKAKKETTKSKTVVVTEAVGGFIVTSSSDYFVRPVLFKSNTGMLKAVDAFFKNKPLPVEGRL